MNKSNLIAHILRKYDPSEWAGTETAVRDLIAQLKDELSFKIFCPEIIPPKEISTPDPFKDLSIDIQRFKSFLPVIGLSEIQQQQLRQIGGNLMSFELIKNLWNEQDLKLIHIHTLGLIGGIARTIAKKRQIPLVVSLHGGVIDLPKDFNDEFKRKMKGSLSYARAFNFFLNSHKTLAEADAIITFNKKEKDLLQQKYPHQNILWLPHGIDIDTYTQDRRQITLANYPQLKNKQLGLVVARIDPVKNQLWLIKQLPRILKNHPNFILGLLGPTTDYKYLNLIENKIQELNVGHAVTFLGALSPNDPFIGGLYQLAEVTLLSSIAEPFGLVILESWAAGTPVISSDTSGPSDIIKHRESGWLFNLENPDDFHQSLNEALIDKTRVNESINNEYKHGHKMDNHNKIDNHNTINFDHKIDNNNLRSSIIQKSRLILHEKYDHKIMANKTRDLYLELIDKK